MKKCDIDSDFVCRTHKGIVALDINFPNLGNYCDDYVEAMHEELHSYIYYYLEHQDTTQNDDVTLSDLCEFCSKEELNKDD